MELLSSKMAIPVILVMGGVLFLFFAIGGEIGAKISTDKIGANIGTGRIKAVFATIIGVILLWVGVAIYGDISDEQKNTQLRENVNTENVRHQKHQEMNKNSNTITSTREDESK